MSGWAFDQELDRLGSFLSGCRVARSRAGPHGTRGRASQRSGVGLGRWFSLVGNIVGGFEGLVGAGWWFLKWFYWKVGGGWSVLVWYRWF